MENATALLEKNTSHATSALEGTDGKVPLNNPEHPTSSAAATSDLSPKDLGRRGEAAAVNFLKRKGLEILEQNWTCFAGEADIIARDESTLCFVEVKTRRGVEKGFPEEAITPAKRDRYEKIAACYLQTTDYVDFRVRFDVISILVVSPTRAFLRYHVNAFGGE